MVWVRHNAGFRARPSHHADFYRRAVFFAALGFPPACFLKSIAAELFARAINSSGVRGKPVSSIQGRTFCQGLRSRPKKLRIQAVAFSSGASSIVRVRGINRNQQPAKRQGTERGNSQRQVNQQEPGKPKGRRRNPNTRCSSRCRSCCKPATPATTAKQRKTPHKSRARKATDQSTPNVTIYIYRYPRPHTRNHPRRCRNRAVQRIYRSKPIARRIESSPTRHSQE